MPRIQRLDPLVINQIAAGEVIERPGSVVKELLENSIDALATRIEVDAAQGGMELIRVVDDGEGIEADDLPLALASHATSKIRGTDDLFRVQSMGFRGEALASIASVSRFQIRSRTAESLTGHEISSSGTDVNKPQPCGCPCGTQIEVRQLFFNTPVRRKFLKSTSTEFGYISEQFTRIALAHPRLHAVLRHNDKRVYELPPSNDLLDRLRLFYGEGPTEKLIRVDSQTDNVRLWGYVAHPSQSKPTRRGQYLFLNGRWIQDRSLQHALTEAYRGLLMVGRYPVAFLFLELPADQVDVNVHPTKAEVRFRDVQQLYRQLLTTLRTKFLSIDLNSTLHVPRGQDPSAPPVDPERQQEVQRELVAWASGQLAAWKPPTESAEPATDDWSKVVFEDSLRPTGNPIDGPVEIGNGHTPGNGLLESEFVANPSATNPVAQPNSIGAPAPAAVPIGDTLTPRAMQVHDCYLVVESQDGLTVIDQHALHERVLYEQLRRRVLSGGVEAQKMLVPETLEVSAHDVALLAEHREVLEQLGFGIEEFGGNTVLITSYPAMLQRVDIVSLVRDLADQLDGPRQALTRRDILDRLLHMMSCKAAIKAGQRLKPEEVETLLAQRHLIDDAHHCPHGRPTALVFSRAELDRQFGRLG